MNDYTIAILETYDRATDTELRDGASWYPSMARIMREHSVQSGYTIEQCAAVYAANSINTPWQRNIALASAALADRGMTGGTLGMVIRKVNAILNGADIDTTLSADPKNMKITNFRRNLAGDMQAVTVDRWANRVATRGKDSSVPKGAKYIELANAYREAAALRNVDPATMQAVTWCVVRESAE